MTRRNYYIRTNSNCYKYYAILIAVLILMSTVANLSIHHYYYLNFSTAPQHHALLQEQVEHSFNNNNSTTTLQPQPPPGLNLYLEGRTENAGLGHSFMALNNLLTMANLHNISTRLVMRTTNKNHGFDLRNAMRIKRYFFDDLLLNPLPNGETNWNTTCVRMKSSPVSLADDVERVKREYTTMMHGEQKEQHNRSNCTIFIMNDVRPNNAHQMEKNLPFFRHLFQLNDKNITRQSVIQRNARLLSSKEQQNNVVHIAMHIRRGDLFQFISKSTKKVKGWGKFQATNRLVPVSAYTSLLKQLLTMLLFDGDDDMKRDIRVTVHCEGIVGNATVPDVDGTMIDLQQEIIMSGILDKSINNYTTNNKAMRHDDVVTFYAGDEDPLQAFDDICYSSDIFIAGPSAFSHLVGVLCPQPIILAMQDLQTALVKYSYSYIPNAMMLDVTRGDYYLPHLGLNSGVELIKAASFNQTEFELLLGKQS